MKRLALTALLLTSCTTPWSPYKLLRKTHELERIYVKLVPVKKPNTSFPYYIGVTMLDDEDFIFTLIKYRNNGSKQRIIYVDKDTYNKYEVGDEINLDKIRFEDVDIDVEY